MRAVNCALVMFLYAATLGCQAHTPDNGEAARGEHADSAADPLPSTLKGYELYAWAESDGLAFALITGTNRQKTVAEVTGEPEQSGAEGWVVVRGHGIEQLRSVLRRVPADTPVVVSQLDGLAPLSDAMRVEVTEIVANH